MSSQQLKFPPDGGMSATLTGGKTFPLRLANLQCNRLPPRTSCRPPVRGALSQYGFTLIEVLVALAIVAITLGAGLRVSGAQINNTERRGDMLRAQLCAENELIKLRLLRQLPDTGDIRFVCQQAGLTLEGRLEVKATPNPSFRKVDSVVLKPAGEGQEPQTLLRLATIVGRF